MPRDAVHETNATATAAIPTSLPAGVLTSVDSTLLTRALRHVRLTNNYNFRGIGQLKMPVEGKPRDPWRKTDLGYDTDVRLTNRWKTMNIRTTISNKLPESMTGLLRARAEVSSRVLLFDADDVLIYETPAKIVATTPTAPLSANADWSVAVPEAVASRAKSVGLMHHNRALPANLIPLSVGLDEQDIPTFMGFNANSWTVLTISLAMPAVDFKVSRRLT